MYNGLCLHDIASLQNDVGSVLSEVGDSMLIVMFRKGPHNFSTIQCIEVLLNRNLLDHCLFQFAYKIHLF